MARKYKIEGTRDFLYWSIGLLLLGLWALKDGWFPSAKVLKDHPRYLSVGFENSGILAEYRVAEGDDIRALQVLAVQQRSELENRQNILERYLQAAEDESAVAGSRGAAAPGRRTEEIAGWTAELAEVRRQMAQRELRSPTNGYVRSLLKQRGALVKAQEPVIELIVRDHFYAFNKSLAVICLLASAVCAVIHLKVR